MMDVALRGRAQITSWHVMLFEGDYTPQDDDTAANIVGRSTELTAYTATARPGLVVAAAAGGATNNSASIAQFELTADKTVHGFAVISSAGKATGSGVLLALQRLDTPRAYSSGDTVTVPVTLSLSNPE
ncbi:MAG: hypothetical protein Q4G70_01375 [Pseudomonadota bacterium]|nr:hypothetical protein [Pseudomonadota bacterium]